MPYQDIVTIRTNAPRRNLRDIFFDVIINCVGFRPKPPPIIDDAKRFEGLNVEGIKDLIVSDAYFNLGEMFLLADDLSFCLPGLTVSTRDVGTFLRGPCGLLREKILSAEIEAYTRDINVTKLGGFYMKASDFIAFMDAQPLPGEKWEAEGLYTISDRGLTMRYRLHFDRILMMALALADDKSDLIASNQCILMRKAENTQKLECV